jgi:DNA repair protein RecN (Recombination protein N)
VIIASRSTTPTVIFDEVDVGIGGATADAVGSLLQTLGQRIQVVCVTHLPQVAAQADWQWQVSKATRDGVTLSAIQPLDEATAASRKSPACWAASKLPTSHRQHARELLGSGA